MPPANQKFHYNGILKTKLDWLLLFVKDTGKCKYEPLISGLMPALSFYSGLEYVFSTYYLFFYTNIGVF